MVIQETKHDFEVAILGNGLSGSMLGTILGKKGASVVIIDEDQHPRFAAWRFARHVRRRRGGWFCW